MTRRFDAVLFDLDGVLVDTEPWWDGVRREFATTLGLAWALDDTRALMGANTAGWSRIMRERLGPTAGTADEIRDVIVGAMAARYRTWPAPVMDGAPALVRRIAATRPVAIASSSPPVLIRAAVDALGLHDALGATASSDEVVHGKPAPDVYLLAAARVGVDPERCLVVEDSVHGVSSGKAAGMTTVLVPNPSVPPLPEAYEIADVVLARLTDLDPDTLET